MKLNKQPITIQALGEKEVPLSARETKIATFYNVHMREPIVNRLTHHILLIDVSKSMDIYLEQLKQTLNLTLKTVAKRKGNIVSVILYSHHNQTTPILCSVPCDNASYELASVFSVIENEVYTKDNTIFSEALTTALDYVTNDSPDIDQHHILLLSDGAPVPSQWSIEEEVTRCKNVATQYQTQNVIFNAMGFGVGYNRKLLIDLVQTAKTGMFYHIDFINDYKSLMTTLLTDLANKKPFALSIKNQDYLIVDDMMRYSAPQRVSLLCCQRTGLLVTFDGPLLCDHAITPSPDSVGRTHLAELGYSLAALHLQDEKLEDALSVLKLTGDVHASQQLQDAYSFQELGKAISYIQDLRLKPKRRYKRGFNLKAMDQPKPQTLCVLEVLQDLIQHPNATLCWDYSYDYYRIGFKKERQEDWYQFQYPSVGFTEVSRVVIGSSKLNVGLQVKVWGQVENTLNHLKLDAYVVRDFNVVLNGNLNIPYVWCELPPDLKQKYRRAKLLKKIIPYGKKEICVLNLSHLPVTHHAILNQLKPEVLAEKIYQSEVLATHLSCAKKLVQQVEVKPTVSPGGVDVTALLKAYRVTAAGLYEPLEVTPSSNAVYEVYLADKLSWDVARFPRKLIEGQALSMYEPRVDEDPLIYMSRLNEVVKTLKAARQSLLNEVNLIRLSSGLMKQSIFVWDEEKVKGKVETDKLLNQNAVIGEKVLESVALVNEIKIRQLKYKVLVPIN